LILTHCVERRGPNNLFQQPVRGKGRTSRGRIPVPSLVLTGRRSLERLSGELFSTLSLDDFAGSPGSLPGIFPFPLDNAAYML